MIIKKSRSSLKMFKRTTLSQVLYWKLVKVLTLFLSKNLLGQLFVPFPSSTNIDGNKSVEVPDHLD